MPVYTEFSEKKQRYICKMCEINTPLKTKVLINMIMVHIDHRKAMTALCLFAVITYRLVPVWCKNATPNTKRRHLDADHCRKLWRP